jgi:hypothetical protein
MKKLTLKELKKWADISKFDTQEGVGRYRVAVVIGVVTDKLGKYGECFYLRRYGRLVEYGDIDKVLIKFLNKLSYVKNKNYTSRDKDAFGINDSDGRIKDIILIKKFRYIDFKEL